MRPDDPVDLDPEVLSDPVPSSERGEDAPDSDEPEAARAEPQQRGLVPLDPFRKYMSELRRYPPLTREEEQALARRYRESGDRDALFRLVTSNLMLVVRVALSFRRAARNLLDLVQEGNLGLLAAIERFDPEVGVRLPTYAAWWIRAYIVKFLLEAAGYEVGPKMLAEHFGVSEEDVKDVERALHSRDVSLDAPIGDEEDRTRGDVTPASGPTVEEEVARRELQDKVQAAIRRFRVDLNERERTILDERLLAEDPATLQAIGDKFGTTREAVRQAESRLMSRLKEFLRTELGDLASIRIGPS
jgi:RNA polymerase sigma-32 factor